MRRAFACNPAEGSLENARHEGNGVSNADRNHGCASFLVAGFQCGSNGLGLLLFVLSRTHMPQCWRGVYLCNRNVLMQQFLGSWDWAGMHRIPSLLTVCRVTKRVEQWLSCPLV